MMDHVLIALDEILFLALRKARALVPQLSLNLLVDHLAHQLSASSATRFSSSIKTPI